MKKSFSFNILNKDSNSKARAGEIHTPHGVINTPCFVAVGTQATVKGLSPNDLKSIGVQLIFGNTYHLHLRPGEDVVEEFGGVGSFMGWNGPTITDSGGFQVFSLGQKKFVNFETGVKDIDIENGTDSGEEDSALVKINDNGVVFRSHIDGSRHLFTPEESIRIQKKLGADIILCFDECAPHPSSHKYAREAMERTHSWALRSLAEFNLDIINTNNMQALYGVVQGGIYKDLREESTRFIGDLPFDGIAIGGVSVGESKKDMRDVLGWVSPLLPDSKPRHLLGIGEIDDIFAGIESGMDTFDCVIPTRFGRYGVIFAPPWESEAEGRFRIDIRRAKYARDSGKMSQDCDCYTCLNFTRAYVHHLFKANELLAYRLASYHNIHFVVRLVDTIRKSILEGNFDKLKKKWCIL
ncbi:queuine tRNA-ribosyltransferase [Candidatus Levyibacteriota bacterium]|nr:queuine tRNA-ribosyltransferase [Candidatus Levybacteria bacterium]